MLADVRVRAEPRNGCTDDVGLARAPGLQAPKSFNVLTDTYGAEYGKRAGGQISIVTSSGTNQWHGDAFGFLRNSAFDARNFFDETIGTPPFKRH